MVSRFFWGGTPARPSTAKVKKDDAEGLAALLDNLEEGESWEDPTAGRRFVGGISWDI